MGDQENVEPESFFLVLAKFDFTATDGNALSFNEGDIIHVFSRLESGWWDGMLDGRRGWFPSNYVEEVNENEVTLTEGKYEREPEPGGNMLNVDDVLTGDWGGDWGGVGLDQLAREMMEGNEEPDDGLGFMVEAQRRKVQLNSDLTSEFGLTMEAATKAILQDDTLKARRMPLPEVSKDAEEGEDAWIPSITPDGQVYYHNTLTGEDSWRLPLDTPFDSSNPYSQSDDQFFSSRTSSTPRTLGDNDNFLGPSRPHSDIPYPWVVKLSDDGRDWSYHNRLTGQTQRERPAGDDAESTVDIGLGMTQLSISSRPPTIRQSLLLQRKAIEELKSKMIDSLRLLTTPTPQPTMGLLLEIVNEALREILEATVAGSAAEEEMSRAADLGSESGMTAALLREEGAIEALQAAYHATLASIRDLLQSFGYIGPGESMEDLPRPRWVSDMTLIGSIGVLSSVVHAAVISKRPSGTGLSIWSEVLRSATKLKDVVNNFPSLYFTGDTCTPTDQREEKKGKRVVGWLGYDPLTLGEPMGGKWGFGKIVKSYKLLDQSMVVECQRVREEYDDTLRALAISPDLTEGVMEVLRVTNKFAKIVTEIDIASKVDLDGDMGNISVAVGSRTREDDLQEYAQLVEQARLNLADLDITFQSINEISISILNALSAGRNPSDDLDQLTIGLNTAFRSLSTLLIISREQQSANEQGLIRGQIGVRSSKFNPSKQPSTSSQTHTRSGSITSTASRASRLSDLVRRKVKGLTEDLTNAEEASEARDRPGEMLSSSVSASQSQTSLHNVRRVSASNSSTSLTHQPTDSDSAQSQKANNRSSLLKAFRRHRPGSDTYDNQGGSSRKGTSKKLAKLLGEDVSQIPAVSVPPPHPHPYRIQQHQMHRPPLAQPETPWYMMDDYVAGEIIFDEKGAVKAGTLRALIVRLTSHTIADTPFFQAFLLTFRSFTNPAELFNHLQDRYYLPSPPELSPEQYEEWRNKKKWYIQLRVVNALRQWLEKHFIRATDDAVLNKVEELALRMPEEDGKAELMSKQLLQLVAKRRQSEPEQINSGASGSLLSPPAPLLPRVSGRPLRLTDIAPLELARQLTILEFTLYQRIKPTECLQKIYADEVQGQLLAPNVRKVILTANILAGWIALVILQHNDVKLRAQVYKHWLQTAIECRNLNNFSSVAAIIAGLNSSPVSRLRRTRELLSAKTLAIKEDLDKAMDSSRNFMNYKEMLKTINPPCVPFLGFYLTALVFIEDGNKAFIKPGAPTKGNSMPPSTSNGSLSAYASSSQQSNPAQEETVIPTKPLINFFKRSLSAEILRDIQQYQSMPYRLARSRLIQDWMQKEFDIVHNDTRDYYELSVEVEPREKEEERITRMLHDSGFI
ncbi:cell division control protein 25 [Cryptococcus neoformans var. grubii Br795]|nr:cell division control protein 25 [Cryptococcus neoformans var. grubii Br795]